QLDLCRTKSRGGGQYARTLCADATTTTPHATIHTAPSTNAAATPATTSAATTAAAVEPRYSRLDICTLRKWFEHDNRLIGAWNDGFGDGDAFFLLVKYAKSRRTRFARIEFHGRTRRIFRAAGLNLGNGDIEAGAMADALFDDR